MSKWYRFLILSGFLVAATATADKESGNAKSTSNSTSTSDASQSQEQISNPSSSSNVSTVDSSRDYFLALPSASPDYGSTAPCLESRRGITLGPIGWSGRTRTNAACMAQEAIRLEYEQCTGIADRLYHYGDSAAAITQLMLCAGAFPDGS